VFAIFTQVLPILADQGVPFIPELLEFSPLPQDLVEKWKRAMQPKPEQIQAQQQAQQIQIAGAAAKVDETKSKTTLNRAKAQSEQMKAG
jgi:predicted PurR-regulated permease PerM